MGEHPDITPVSKKDLHDGLESAVMIIETYGHKYWPIFERLEKAVSYTHLTLPTILLV